MTNRKLRAMTGAHPNIAPFDQVNRETRLYDLNNVLSALELSPETTCRGITMTKANSRTVRIFLISTFRDFEEERNLMVRKNIPYLAQEAP